MNMFFPNRLLLILFLMLPTLAFAQPGKDRPGGERFERIKAAREAFMTEELSLTKAEAKAFFPVYWTQEDKVRTARKEARTAVRQQTKTSPMTEADAKRVIELRRQEMREQLALRIAAEDAYLRVLPAAKVIRIPEAERAFRERLWEHRRQGRGRPEGPRGGDRGGPRERRH